MNSFNNALLGIVLSVPAILLAFTAQGYARALVADKLGDKGPRAQGRLNFNPLSHIDPMGFLLILIFKFGWTKPVEVNASALKRGRKDYIKVAVAAPIANLIIGFIFSLLLVLYMVVLGNVTGEAKIIGALMIEYVAVINISLAIFNLIPIPGLAGFEILKAVSPKTFFKVADNLYRYSLFILIGIIFLNNYTGILSRPTNFIFEIFLLIGNLMFGFLF